MPPHIGHVKLITQAANQCELLYVVMAEDPMLSAQSCRNAGLEPIPAEVRLDWLRKHFAEYTNIRFLYLDETDIPPFPDVDQWCAKFRALVPHPIDAKFIGEEKYIEMNQTHFPECAIYMVKRGVDSPPVSASQILADPRGCIHQVIPTAKEYFSGIKI